LWLARKGIQDKIVANPAFLLGILADDLNSVSREHARLDQNYLVHLPKAQAVRDFLAT
jgi:hypothetical protein